MDSIVCDFFLRLWESYFQATGERVTTDQIKTWDMDQYVSDPKTLRACFYEPDFFRHLKPIPGAMYSLLKLQQMGHEIIIVSSPCTSHSASEKIEWCKEHLPFIDHKNIWLGHNKFHIQGHVLIDDGPHNADQYREHHPNAFIATIAYPYNKDAAYDLRAGHHSTPRLAWEEIVEAIQRLSERF